MSEKVERINIKLQDFKGVDHVAEFLEALDKATAEGKKVTATVQRDQWTNYLNRWLLRRNCRIVII